MIRNADVYKLVEVRDGKEWTWWVDSHMSRVDRLKAKWPKARIFNRYGEEV